MAIFPARSASCGKTIFQKITSILVFSVILSIFVLYFAPLAQVSAQTPTPTTAAPLTNAATWEFDTVVTEVGKNADRARQLLWWVFQHPGIHTAPIIATLWGITRNIVYIFIILVIVAFGVSLILGKRRGIIGPIFSGISSPVFGISIPAVFMKIAALLLYVTFSYILIVGLVQTSDIIMRFFIETVGGKDLFNIIFAGAGNTEANYITFVGYRDINPLSLEMVNTSLFMIKLTSLTYYVMAVTLILRTIILWFLLIIAPFLALLMPFVFIRNTGWIWIGVFFQWLFYGPIFALFLAALTRIWVAGIPYSFDFSRVNQPSGQVYRTSINILWGGPAQTLSPGNSANYVDTFAEYVIALVMLWTAILLPWLLLRIFRDYCCAMIAAGQNTLSAIFDRMRQFPTPPPSPVGPTSTAGKAVELPFRQRIEEKVRDIQRVHIEDIKDVSRTSTNEIARAMDMSVSKLSDVSRFETNVMKRSEIMQNLNKIQAPERIAVATERERWMMIREELTQRAEKGDRVAQTIIHASEKKTESLAKEVIEEISSRKQVARVPVRGVYAPLRSVEIAQDMVAVDKIAKQTQVPVSQVVDVIKSLEVEDLKDITKLQSVSKSTGLKEEKVKEIVNIAQQASQTMVPSPVVTETEILSISQHVGISQEKTKTILSRISTTEIENKQKIAEVARKTGVAEGQVKEVVRQAQQSKATQKAVTAAPAPVSVEDYEEVKRMWLQHYRNAPVPVTETIQSRDDWLLDEEKKLTNISNLLSSVNPQLKQEGLEKVSEILPFMLLGGFSETEILAYIKAKLEASKQILEESKIESKVKEETEKKMKEEAEETLVEVEQPKEEEKKAVGELSQKMGIDQEKKKPESKSNGENRDKK